MEALSKHLAAYFATVAALVAAIPAALLATGILPSFGQDYQALQQVVVTIASVLVMAFIIRNRASLTRKGLIEGTWKRRIVVSLPYVSIGLWIISIIAYFNAVFVEVQSDSVMTIFVFAGLFLFPVISLTLLAVWEFDN